MPSLVILVSTVLVLQGGLQTHADAHDRLMPRLHQRNKLRATSCAQLDACCGARNTQLDAGNTQLVAGNKQLAARNMMLVARNKLRVACCAQQVALV